LENRIPNSKNVPYPELFDTTTNEIKNTEQLKECKHNMNLIETHKIFRFIFK